MRKGHSKFDDDEPGDLPENRRRRRLRIVSR